MTVWIRGLMVLVVLGTSAVGSAQTPVSDGQSGKAVDYPWLPDSARVETLAERFPPSDGHERVPADQASFAGWLRHLPMKHGRSPVRSYDDDVILGPNAPQLAGVVDLDLIGDDLQQCADAIIRLRAEYLWSKGARNRIAFQFTSGDLCRWADWVSGLRPQVNGNRVRWVKRASPDSSRHTFRKYLETVFYYAGTISLSYDSVQVPADEIAPGDFFLESGSPGHAVIVLDVATDPEGRQQVLVGQSFMPAQDFHVLKTKTGGAWFNVDPASPGLDVPSWKTFPWSSLRRFRE
ncbi:MAG: DUF4846 domain-containing protein [Candidatus Eisenbacteria sp.]|nr:DUF4846 domain-containing protein [Candidatus Eisenbacteria bacterium]